MSQAWKDLQDYQHLMVLELSIVVFRDTDLWTEDHYDDCEAERLIEIYCQLDRVQQQLSLTTACGVMRNSITRTSGHYNR